MTDNDVQQVVNDLYSPEFATQVAQQIKSILNVREMYRKSLQDGQRLLAHPANYFNSMSDQKVAEEVTHVLKKDSILPSSIRSFIMDMCTHTLEDNQRKREKQILAEENIKKGDDYMNTLTNYQTVEGCKMLTIAVPDASVSILEDNKVHVKYTGKLLDGTVFDSNEDALFSPNQLVPGFKSCLLASVEGGSYTYVIPSCLAYGNNQQGMIPPGSTLIFDVTILSVE